MNSGVVTQSKVRAEKVGQLQMQKEGTVAGSLHARKKTQLMGVMWKAAELEFPLVLSGVAITQGSEWKTTLKKVPSEC